MNSIQLYTFIKHIAILFPTFVIIFTVRGFFQAAAAYLVGDITPQEEGFFTINPLAHVDVFGTLTLSVVFAAVSHFLAAGGGVFVTLLLVGMMMSLGVRYHYFVPIDATQFTYRRLGVLVTTLATTVSYLCVVLTSMYVLLYSFDLLGGASPVFLMIQQVTSSLTEWALFWAVLSLVPLPPFEGGMLLPGIFGDIGQAMYDFLEPYGVLIFLSLLWIPGVRDMMFVGLNAFRFLLYQGLMQLVFI